MVDLVGEGVCVLVPEVVLQIVNMEVAVRKGLSRGNVEISNDFVNLDAAFKTAAFLALCIKVFGVVFALALLDALATTEGP